jgi:ABC transporter substrate binding protein
MRRRDFMAGLGGSVLWPFAARGQQTGERPRRIGWLVDREESDPQVQAWVSWLREGLRRLGWIEGQNLRIDVRFGARDHNRIRELATELVRLAPDAILTNGGPDDFAAAFAKISQQRVAALSVGTDPLFLSYRDRIIALAARHAIPTAYFQREAVIEGGLASYGPNVRDAFRRAGVYAGRILKGEKPGDLPVQRSTKIDLFINMKTAKALGLAIPETLLAIADEVIE